MQFTNRQRPKPTIFIVHISYYWAKFPSLYIIGEARKTAERLLKDAQENKENAIEEAKKIHEDSLRKVEEEKKQCDELSAQKAAMVNSLKKLTEDTARLMEKMQG